MEEYFLIDTFINDFMSISKFLNGKKTYIIGVLIGIVATLQYIGYINVELAQLLFGLLAGGGALTIREAVAKLNR